MIRNEKEYQEAVKRLDAERIRLTGHAQVWKEQGFSDAQIATLLEPLESFHMQLVEEVQGYERLKRGQFSEFENLHGLGQALIGLRIARGMNQRQLAKRLNVDETMVSRDERNEYHGITLERASRVLEALGVRLVTRIEVEPMHMPSEQLTEQAPGGA
jgi:DNA-binding XRE family transcriptional regulator